MLRLRCVFICLLSVCVQLLLRSTVQAAATTAPTTSSKPYPVTSDKSIEYLKSFRTSNNIDLSNNYNKNFFNSIGSKSNGLTDQHWFIHYLDQLPKQRVIVFQNDEDDDVEATKHGITREERDAVIQTFHPDDYLSLSNIIQENFINNPAIDQNMWGFIPDVSITHPFIFFHQRKAGGSSLRLTLLAASKKLRLPHHIVCYDGLNCDLYHINYARPAAVYAGHFRWGVQSDFARFSQSNSNDVTSTPSSVMSRSRIRNQFSCLTNFRHPIDRIESCMYFRFGKQLTSMLHKEGGACLSELTLDKLEEVLYWIDDYGQSCLNEPFRILSGFEEEATIDHLMDSVDVQQKARGERQLRGANKATSSSSNRLTPLSYAVFNTTLSHTARCSPAIVEIPESYKAIAHRIPTLGNVGGFVAEKKSNVNKHHITCSSTTGQHRALIGQKAALEMMLYEAVYNKTKAKLSTEDHNSQHFLHQCFHRPVSSTSSSSHSTAVLAATGESTTNKNLLPPVIMVMNNMIHHQFQSMLHAITRTHIASLIDLITLKTTTTSSTSKKSQQETHNNETTTPEVIKFSLTLMNADQSRVIVATESNRKGDYHHLDHTFCLSHLTYGDKVESIESACPSLSANQQVSLTDKQQQPSQQSGGNTFNRMTIIMKDPFVQIFLQVFANQSVNMISLLQVDDQNKDKDKDKGRDSERDTEKELNQMLISWIANRQKLRNESMLSLGSLSSLNNNNVSAIRERQLYLSKATIMTRETKAVMSHHSKSEHGSTATVGSASQDKSSPSSIHLKRSSKTKKVSTPSLPPSTMTVKLSSEDLMRYQRDYSLFFTDIQYASLFQQVKTPLQFPTQSFQFFAYEALLDEVYQLQMKMLLVNYQEMDPMLEMYDKICKNYPSKGGNSNNSNQEKGRSEIKTLLLNIQSSSVNKLWKKLLQFLQQWSEKNDKEKEKDANMIHEEKLKCAFGSAAHYIDPTLVMQSIPLVKLFYAMYPKILDQVKRIVRDELQSMGLVLQQMHFMYSILEGELTG